MHLVEQSIIGKGDMNRLDCALTGLRRPTGGLREAFSIGTWGCSEAEYAAMPHIKTGRNSRIGKVC
jgi:hypothetical protein